MSTPSTSNLPSASDNQKILDPESKLKNPPKKEGNQSKPVQIKPRRRPMFTRGEKCLFIHLVVTFSLLVLLFVIYCVHLYLVKHHGGEMFANLLRSVPVQAKSNFLPVGMVFVLPSSYMCNCLLLRTRWSLAPAHCVSARSDPDLSYVLPNWRIMYGMNNGNNTGASETEDYIETQIIKGIPHPHFNRDDFQNNIGLFEHDDNIHLFSYAYLSDYPLTEKALLANAPELKLIGWEDSWHLHAPGAVLMMKSKYVGLFSWGESRGRGVPFVILDFTQYKNWILHIISI